VRHIRLAVAALVAIGWLPVAARADQSCDHYHLVVETFTGTRLPANPADKRSVGTPHPAVNDGVCHVPARQGVVDPRIINPASNLMDVVWNLVDYGPSVPTLTGEIDGLGYSHVAVTFEREWINDTHVAGKLYATPLFDLSPTATGTLVASVTLPDGSTISTTYHTVSS